MRLVMSHVGKHLVAVADKSAEEMGERDFEMIQATAAFVSQLEMEYEKAFPMGPVVKLPDMITIQDKGTCLKPETCGCEKVIVITWGIKEDMAFGVVIEPSGKNGAAYIKRGLSDDIENVDVKSTRDVALYLHGLMGAGN